ncbi:hypothetical protein [Butyrivibrio sp. INlla16]|uniref:hypothetical protein n=1 Tax=Butyrivibrio sp. INlla16 TaxID=1520807 RepID=UPI00088254C0|nr:hypothetical protein [Butyrivibrio sp. INlla16]SDB32137.1 hypothetical protein SAMN02910263_01543 [Butyrivibrio sp. INlla16]
MNNFNINIYPYYRIDYKLPRIEYGASEDEILLDGKLVLQIPIRKKTVSFRTHNYSVKTVLLPEIENVDALDDLYEFGCRIVDSNQLLSDAYNDDYEIVVENEEDSNSTFKRDDGNSIWESECIGGRSC